MQLFSFSNKPTIPKLIIKNTLFFAVSQAFQGIPMQIAITTGASMISYLTGSKALAGVPGMLISGSRFIVAFPTGYLTDKYGEESSYKEKKEDADKMAHSISVQQKTYVNHM